MSGDSQPKAWPEKLTREVEMAASNGITLYDQRVKITREEAASKTQCIREQLEFHALGRRLASGRGPYQMLAKSWPHLSNMWWPQTLVCDFRLLV